MNAKLDLLYDKVHYQPLLDEIAKHPCLKGYRQAIVYLEDIRKGDRSVDDVCRNMDLSRAGWYRLVAKIGRASKKLQVAYMKRTYRQK